MGVPGKVNIMGLEFSVEEVECVDKSDPSDGMIDFASQVIRIDRALGDAAKEQTFLHELVHGILGQLKYDEQNGDERLVQGLAIGLHQALYNL